MFEVWLYTLLSVFLASSVSLLLAYFVGARVERRMLLLLVSFAAGALFGDAFVHLLPEATEESGLTVLVSSYILLGIIAFFILEKGINWHHYHLPHTKEQKHPFVFTNLVGDGFHNLIDGFIIAASFLVSVPVGIATSLAVFFHEIPQEIGDYGILRHGGFSRRHAMLFNIGSAALALLGAVVGLIVGSITLGLAIFLIPFAAGGFIYVAGSDLIPELHKHNKISQSLPQLIAFLAGIAAMYALLLLE